MQNQQECYNTSEETPTPSSERQSKNDPREQQLSQSQESTHRSSEEGDTSLNERDFWPYEGQKLQPEPKNHRSMGGWLALLVLVCAIFLAGSLFGLILNWFTWAVVTVLMTAGIAMLITNWRVVIIPMPPCSFRIMEHARLAISNGAGRITIRRGEEGVVSVNSTKRASGFGINPRSMQINSNHYSDVLEISTHMTWNMFQFGLRRVDFEITVPASCDVRVQNGSGQVVIQGTSGEISVHTGSGRVSAHDLQGQIAMKTGSGRIEAGNLQGLIDLRTGSGRIEAGNLQGQINLHTGSGRIEVTRSALSGKSSLKTGSNSIHVDSSLDPLGDYTFQTGSGSITLILPADAAFTLDARTGSGGVHNAFGHNKVGNGPRAPLKLRTGSGRIHIHRNGIF
jgi:hypothetical protein